MNNNKKIRVGVSPLSWTNDAILDLGDQIPLETCLEEAAEAGYEGVELGRKFPRDALVLKPMLVHYGLSLASGWHSGFLAERSVDEEWAAALPHIELLLAMNCNVMVYGECSFAHSSAVVPLNVSPQLTHLDLGNYCDKLNEFGSRLHEHGLQLAYHHHLQMLVETLDETTTLLTNTSEHVGLCLDTGHAFAAGFVADEIIQQFGKRIAHIHLKDVRQTKLTHARLRELSFEESVRDGIFCVPDDGAIDFGPLASFLVAQPFSGWIIMEAEQDPAIAEPFSTVAHARLNIESLFGI